MVAPSEWPYFAGIKPFSFSMSVTFIRKPPGITMSPGLWSAGQAHGICAYGTEAMHVLRAEKGYVIVGQDTDGTVTADDAGLRWAVGKNKADFLGFAAMHLAFHCSQLTHDLLPHVSSDRGAPGRQFTSLHTSTYA